MAPALLFKLTFCAAQTISIMFRSINLLGRNPRWNAETLCATHRSKATRKAQAIILFDASTIDIGLVFSAVKTGIPASDSEEDCPIQTSIAQLKFLETTTSSWKIERATCMSMSLAKCPSPHMPRTECHLCLEMRRGDAA